MTNLVDTFKKFLPMANLATLKRTTLPILKHIAISDGKIYCTDLENWVEMPIECTDNFTISFRMMKELLATKPNSITVKVTDKEEQYRVFDQALHRGGAIRPNVTRTRFIPFVELTLDGEQTIKYVGKPISEFPKRPEGKFLSLRQWNPLLLQYMVKANVMTSKDELKPSLMGVNLQQENNEIAVCGTDGHRLARISNVPVKSSRTKDFIIPSKAVKFVDKFMGDEVSVGLRGHSHIQFNFEDDVVLYARLIQERYPDYNSVFPDYSTSEFKVNRLDLLRTLKVGDVCANKSTHQVQLLIKAQSKFIELSCDDTEYQRNWKAKIAIEDRKGGEDDFMIGYNLKYLMTILKTMGSKEVTFHHTSPVDATLITGDDPRTTFLLMPIRLND